jgi:hypothetical protein
LIAKNKLEERRKEANKVDALLRGFSGLSFLGGHFE